MNSKRTISCASCSRNRNVSVCSSFFGNGISGPFLGPYADRKKIKDLLEAELRGEELKKFTEEWLVNPTMDFKLIKLLRLRTFASMKKTVKVKAKRKVVQFSTQSDIFVKISLMQQNSKVDLKGVFFYPLGPIPGALATNDGELMKTSKSNLINALEKGVTTGVSVPILFDPIYDGTVLVQMLKILA